MVRNNKKNKLPGYKIFSFSLVVMLLGLWLVTTSYVAQQTEREVRSTFVQHDKSPSSVIYFELVDYQSSFFGGYFLTRLRANDEQLDEALNGLVFRTDTKHGPLIFNEYGVQPAFARFDSYLDLSSTSREKDQLVKRIFKGKDPVSAKLVVDYKQRRHFQATTAAFKYEVADIVLAVADGHASGQYLSDSKTLPVEYQLENISFKQGEVAFESSGNVLAFDGRELQDGKISAPTIKIMADHLKSPVLVGSSIKLSHQAPGSLLAGIRSKITMLNRDGEINHSNLSLNLANIQLDTVFELIDQYEEQHNLVQQIEWTLEDAADSQEGQDRLLELYHRQEKTVLPRADVLVAQLLNTEDREISFSLGSEKQEPGSYIQADFAYNGSQRGFSEDN